MTKDLLEQYPDICGELKDLDSIVTDSVTSSSLEPPYGKHTVSVRGVPYTERRVKLERQKAEIEAFVEGIPSAGLRRIVTYRALQGLSWGQVAAKMGYRYSAESARKQYEKILK